MLSKAECSEVKGFSSSPVLDKSVEELADDHARTLDKRAREIEALFKKTWVELADIVIAMRDNAYFRRLGFRSLGSWMVDALPCSKSWAYLAVGVREELKDIADEDLKQMPLANASVMRKMPKRDRTQEKVIRSAKKLPPEKFLPQLAQDKPELALEAKVKRSRTYTVSQINKIDEGMNLWRELNPGSPLSDSDIEEYMWVEYINEHQGQTPE